jgi:hypothetical protein
MAARRHPIREAFLSSANVREIGGRVAGAAGVPAIMKKWADTVVGDFDTYSSAQGDMSESLAYVNQTFLTWLGRQGRDRAAPISFVGRGQSQHHPESRNYPKLYVEDGVENYDVDDFRAHDAQFEQHVMRTNANFRYNNRLLPWQCAMQKRYYDREAFPEGLRDHRELEQPARAYDMSGAWGPNKYTSSDSLMYCWDGP